MTEFEELAKLKEWTGLLRVLQTVKKASYRQILAVHTSECCTRDHEPRMTRSLKAAGLDNSVVLETMYIVTLSLKAVHLGQANDSLPPLIVTSSPQPTVRDAQEQACQVTLAFLLSVGADQIRLHPSALAHGVQSVAWLREAGHKVFVAAGPPAPGTWREWMLQLPPNGPTQVTHGAWIGPMQANTAEVMEALLSLSQPRKSHRFDPSRLPPHVRQTLEQKLLKKGLKPFLLEHSDIFEVHESGGRQWQFSIKTHSRQPPPPTYMDSSAPTAGWSDQTGMPGPPGPPGLIVGGSGLPPPPPPPVHDDYRKGWDDWWSGRWEDGTTKEWSGCGGGWCGSAEREAPPAQHSWESLNGASSSHTQCRHGKAWASAARGPTAAWLCKHTASMTREPLWEASKKVVASSETLGLLSDHGVGGILRPSVFLAS